MNTARLGYKQHVTDGRCEGRITVLGSGKLIVNELLELGYNAGNYGSTDPANGANTFGELIVSGSNAVAQLNTVLVGVGSGASTPNRIQINSRGHVILTNTAGMTNGTTHGRLGALIINNGSLTLFVVDTNARIYTTTLSTSGPATINIAAISGVEPTFPVTVPIISYVTGGSGNPAPAFSIGSAPPGYYPDIKVDHLNKVVNLVIKTNAGRTLVWRGNVNGNWDTVTTNWITLGGDADSVPKR